MPKTVASILGYHISPQLYLTKESLKAAKRIETALQDLYLTVEAARPAAESR